MQAQLPNLDMDALVDCAGAFVGAGAGIEILEDVLYFLYQALRERGVDCEFSSCRVNGSTVVGDLDGGFFEQWTCLLYRDMAYTFSHGHALALDDVERVISRKIRDDYNALGGLDPGAMHVNWEREIQDYPSMGLRDEVQASIVRLVEGAVARAVHAHLDDATPGGLDDGVGRRL